MSNMSRAVKNKATSAKSVTNFMGGISYEINPLDTLKMVTASSIFGEPQYYRDGEFAEKSVHKDGVYTVDKIFSDYSIHALDKYKGLKTSEMMENIIDEALKYDYKAVLEYAAELRKTYLMRLNPQIIMVRAAMLTEERKTFTKENPSVFSYINNQVMQRADDVISQFTYYLYRNGSKNNLPNILKRSWMKKIESMSRYEIYKYRNHGIGLIDVIRVCHANNSDIDELMKTGTLAVENNQLTWETLRTSGKEWSEILDTVKLGHMALLRNLRGIFTEITDTAKTNEILENLKHGVLKGKQFPFRYMSAVNAVSNAQNIEPAQKETIKDALEECLDISTENLPVLKGNNAFLSDNSGSAWGTLNSEYGTVKVAEIGNLSAVIGAANSERGSVFKFGDKIKKYPISKRQGILAQSNAISKETFTDVGGCTENGIWLFFKDALKNKKHYDNIFIYSDMQAGHARLFGTSRGQSEYQKMGFVKNSMYFDVNKAIIKYREQVNPKVNIYCIQTAGYNNVLVPEYGYRTNILYGWTGKELLYADIMNKYWDDIDNRK